LNKGDKNSLHIQRKSVMPLLLLSSSILAIIGQKWGVLSRTGEWRILTALMNINLPVALRPCPLTQPRYHYQSIYFDTCKLSIYSCMYKDSLLTIVVRSFTII
jgi:hypothetical protein